MAIVKCKYCLSSFDREVEPCRKIGNRYVHETCLFEKEGGKTYKDVTELVSKIFAASQISWPLIGKQIRKFTEAGIKYSEMHEALSYFYEVKNNKPEMAKGIGIVPFVYKQANSYFSMAKGNHTLKRRIENSVGDFSSGSVEEVVITKQHRKKKTLDLDY